MSDLPYKLNQIAKALEGLGRPAWAEVVAAAGDEIERLKVELDASRTPGPATAAMVGAIRRMTTLDLMELIEMLDLDDPDIIPAFLREHEPAQPS